MYIYLHVYICIYALEALNAPLLAIPLESRLTTKLTMG